MTESYVPGFWLWRMVIVLPLLVIFASYAVSIAYMCPRVFGDEFGDEFGDSLNLVINLVTNSVMNFVNH